MQFLSASVEIKVDDSKLPSQLSRAKSAVTKTVNKIKGAFGKMATSFKVAFDKMVRVAKWGAVAIAGAIAASVKAFATFEEQMANVATMLTEQSMRLIPKFSEKIKQLAIDFGESSTILAQALYNILSASIAPTKALNVLTTAVKAAKAGITETSVAAYAMTGIMNAYGFAAEKAGKVSDILFATVKKGQTTFAQLAPAIGRVTAIAASADVALQEVGAALATITRGGIGTNEAITGLRAAIISLMGKEEGAIKLAKQHGVELSIRALKTKGLIGMIQELSQLQPEVLKNIFKETEARVALNVLIKDQTGFLSDYESIMKSAGATQAAFEIQSETLNFSFRRLWRSIKVTAIEIGGTLAPAIKDATDKMREWISAHRKEAAIKFVDVIETMVTSIAELSKKLIMLSVHWRSAQVAAKLYAIGMYSVADAMTNLDEIFAWIRGDTKTFKNEISRLEIEIGELLLEIAKDSLKAETGMRKLEKVFESLRAKIKAPIKPPTVPPVILPTISPVMPPGIPPVAIDVAEKEQKALNESAQKYLDILDMEVETLRRVGEAHEHAKDMVAFHKELIDQFGESSKQVAEYMDIYRQKLKRLEEAKRLQDMFDSIGEAAASSFEKMISGAGKASEAMKALLRDIARIMMQEIITKPLAAGLGEALGGIFGGLFPAAAPAAQAGGFVERGGLARIHTGETIVPASRGMGDITINVINETGRPIQATETRTQFIDANMKRMVVDIIVDDIVRDGRSGRAIGSVISRM